MFEKMPKKVTVRDCKGFKGFSTLRKLSKFLCTPNTLVSLVYPYSGFILGYKNILLFRIDYIKK